MCLQVAAPEAAFQRKSSLATFELRQQASTDMKARCSVFKYSLRLAVRLVRCLRRPRLQDLVPGPQDEAKSDVNRSPAAGATDARDGAASRSQEAKKYLTKLVLFRVRVRETGYIAMPPICKTLWSLKSG